MDAKSTGCFLRAEGPWLPRREHERQTGHEASLTIHFYKDGLLTGFFVGRELTEGEA